MISEVEGFIPALTDTANNLYGTVGAANICGDIESTFLMDGIVPSFIRNIEAAAGGKSFKVHETDVSMAGYHQIEVTNKFTRYPSIKNTAYANVYLYAITDPNDQVKAI